MRTTCVATRLDAGHANNALPQMARANVELPNRAGEILRGHPAEAIEVLKDPKINVKYVGAIGEVTIAVRRRQSSRARRRCAPRRVQATRKGGEGDVAGERRDSNHVHRRV